MASQTSASASSNTLPVSVAMAATASARSLAMSAPAELRTADRLAGPHFSQSTAAPAARDRAASTSARELTGGGGLGRRERRTSRAQARLAATVRSVAGSLAK